LISPVNRYQQRKEVLRHEIAEDLRLRASAHYNAYQFDDAITVYQQIFDYVSRDETPRLWAGMKNGLGTALSEQGIRTAGEEGARLLGESVAAYRLALQVFTREQLPGRWIIAHNNLGKALQELGQFDEAAAVFREVLSEEANRRDVTLNLVALYHDFIYDHEAALTLLQDWLGRHPGDALGQLNLAEILFATRHFSGSEEHSRVLADLTVEVPQVHAAQRACEIAAILARDDPELANSKLADLVATLDGQPADFTTGWAFSGTLHFVRGEEDLPHRDAILKLFEALEAPNRDAILAGLREVRESFNVALAESGR
jgi:tetratricopeptide (TPR) repeat protein